MGLINWFKDKIILELEYAIKSLRNDFEVLKIALENMRTDIHSLRVKISRAKQGPAQETEGFPSEAEIRQAFGGDIPMELADRYKT